MNLKRRGCPWRDVRTSKGWAYTGFKMKTWNLAILCKLSYCWLTRVQQWFVKGEFFVFASVFFFGGDGLLCEVYLFILVLKQQRESYSKQMEVWPSLLNVTINNVPTKSIDITIWDSIDKCRQSYSEITQQYYIDSSIISLKTTSGLNAVYKYEGYK